MDNPSHWLIFFWGVETTKQYLSSLQLLTNFLTYTKLLIISPVYVPIVYQYMTIYKYNIWVCLRIRYLIPSTG